MRIIAGKFKSRHIDFPRERAVTRPLTDRIRESIFNILGESVVDALILDLFAGSGSFGFEALSRGARFVTFVDHFKGSHLCLNKNTELLGVKEQVSILNLDVHAAIENLEKRDVRFDLIFLDPPHNKGLIKKTLHQLDRFDILNPHGYCIIGHSNKEKIPDELARIRVYRSVKIGQSFVSFGTRSQ